MIDRERGVLPEFEQEQSREAARHMQSLLIDSIGIKTSLQERPTYHDRILIPDNVSFYVPQHVLNTEQARATVQKLQPADIAYIGDTLLQEWMDGTSLVHVFEKDIPTARDQLKDSTRITFAVHPQGKEKTPMDLGIQVYYESISQLLDNMQQTASGDTQPIPENEFTHDISYILRNSAMAEDVLAFHKRMQGSFGVARVIENRQGQKPAVVHELKAVQERTDFSNQTEKTGFQKMAYYALVVEPYHNRGAGQGYPK